MEKYMKGVKLHTKFVILLVGAALLPLAISSIVTLARFQQTLETDATSFGNQLGATAAAEIESFILQQLGFLDYVGIIYHPESPVQKKVADAILENVLYKSEHFVDISIVDKEGFERARKNRILVIAPEDLRDLKDTASYRAAREQGIFVGPVYSREGRIFFDLGRKLVDARGDFVGAVFAQVDAKVMPLVMENISRIAGPSGRVYIVDETGKVIAHPDISYILAERNLADLPLVQKIIARSAEAHISTIYTNETGREVLGSARPMTIKFFDQRSRESFRINWFVITEQPVDVVFGEAEKAKWFAVMISFVVIVLAGILAIFFAGIVSRPIEALHTAALEFGKGNLNYRAVVDTEDEIGVLARSFNIMAQTISESIVSMKKEEEIISAERNKLSVILSGITNAVIAVDLSGGIILFNKAAEALLGLKTQEVFGKTIWQTIKLFEGDRELTVDEYCPPQKDSSYEGPVFSRNDLKIISPNGESHYINLISGHIHEGLSINLRCIITIQDITREFAMEKTKREFVSVAAHQLRTPLTGINWALESLASDVVVVAHKKVIKGALETVHHMSELVNGLLDVSRVEEGRFGAKLERQSIIPVLKKVFSVFQEAARKNNIEFKTDVPTSLPLLDFDEYKIEMVLNNLLDNAIRYTPPEGKVTVSVMQREEDIVFSIEDTGIGISESETERMFTKFFRSPRAQSVFTDGSGLGLYIAKNIVEQHSGKLWFESKENEGTKFYLSLPVPKSRTSV